MHPIKYVWAVRALLYKAIFNKFGNMSYLGRPVFVEGAKGISIGNKVRIFPGLRIQTLENGKIVIGNNVCIEQNVHIVSAEENLNIGSDVVVSANVFISNCEHDFRDTKKSVIDQPNIIKTTSIGDGCFIGYGAIILPGTVLGKHCVVGANAVVRGSFPDYCVIVGVPGRVVKQYSAASGKWERTET